MEPCQASTLAYESEPRSAVPGHHCQHLLKLTWSTMDGPAFDTWLQSIPSLSGEADVTVTLHRLNGRIAYRAGMGRGAVWWIRSRWRTCPSPSRGEAGGQ